tara:strand:- start:722 stop:880 length:159 start_codon:yes stop_codon:yes gene_type:complete
MDIVEKYIENTKELTSKEKKIVKKLYLELSLDPDSPEMENKFDKIFEMEKNV